MFEQFIFDLSADGIEAKLFQSKQSSGDTKIDMKYQITELRLKVSLSLDLTIINLN